MNEADRGAAFRQAAKALNEAGDKTLRKEVYGAFRRAVKPLGESVIAVGSAQLPRRGGLAARVAASKVGQSNATTGKNPAVSMSIRSREGYNLKAMDAGILRHPVFAQPGQKRVWAQQSIRALAFTTPFEAGAPAVRDEVMKALQAVADDIVAKSGGH
jgi:hypothetical protein